MTRDFLIGAGLISAGIAAMTVIIAPITGPPTARVVADRWPEAQAPAPKADQLKITLLEPSMFDPALIGPAEGNPIEQAAERKIFDQGVEANVKEYHRAAEPREYCARHGLVRYYFYRHHHQMWRCRRR